MLSSLRYSSASIATNARNIKLAPLTTRRFKSWPHIRVDEFPYKRLNQKNLNDITSLDSNALPLKSFFAQHMPLMPFPKPAKEQDRTRWVEVNSNSRNLFGHHNTLYGNHLLSHLVPEDVARNIGPFNKTAIRVHGRRPEREQSPPSKFPTLIEYLQKSLNHDGEIHIIPLQMNKADIQATSVQRKRKLKMNRHKYRKRLKEQRTKRRRQK